MPRRTIATLLLGLALAGCPAPPPAGPPLAAGRVWRFTVAAGPDVEQTREVVSVSAEEVVVRVRTLIDGAPVGDPVLVPFPVRPAAVRPAGAPGEPLAVPGAPSLATWIAAGATLAVEDGQPVFPGAVRIEADGVVRFALRRVD